MLAAVALAMIAASGLRSVFGVYIKPMEAEFGWSRSMLSSVAAVSLLLLGATGPIVGRLADRWGPRRVILIALLVAGVGAIATAFVHTLWQVYLTVAVLMTLGAGSVSMMTAAALIVRWFETHRGLVMGVVGGAMSAGQLVIFPLATALTVWWSWRASFACFGVVVLVVFLPLAVAFIRNGPEERGLRAVGARGPATSAAQRADAALAGRVSVFEAARSPQFWLLTASYSVCGYTANGIVLTHFMPHAVEHHFTPFQASSALGVMGAMNIVGTVLSGWLCDRIGRRGPLATYYFVRGLSLLLLLYVWDSRSLHVWAALFGLNYISTVPATTAMTANIFGTYSVGELSGWITFGHQVGAALGAVAAGWIYESTGSYSSAFVSAALLAFLAAGLTLLIRDEPLGSTPTPSPAPA
ncbi:MAG: MFS transporter [Candidatus Rokubacteria bacterium]|nr:MFS transporter [Candidatus Rokubacteria bacterium]